MNKKSKNKLMFVAMAVMGLVAGPTQNRDNGQPTPSFEEIKEGLASDSIPIGNLRNMIMTSPSFTDIRNNLSKLSDEELKGMFDSILSELIEKSKTPLVAQPASSSSGSQKVVKTEPKKQETKPKEETVIEMWLTEEEFNAYLAELYEKDDAEWETLYKLHLEGRIALRGSDKESRKELDNLIAEYGL